MRKSPLYLSRDAFYCLVDKRYVFLDLRNDQYFCLGRAHTVALGELLNGHQFIDKRTQEINIGDVLDSDTSVVMQALLQKGLLVDNEAQGRIPSLLGCGPSISVIDQIDRIRPKIGPAHVWQFFAASVAASRNLRWQSIEHTVRFVEGRKSAQRTITADMDRGVITDLFGIFQALRPYYPRPYLCLFDSLALVHFMARFGIFPLWVFGVQLEPFAAHCWVQAGDMVVNDILDNVRNYTPIMTI